ncbi:MAG: alpha/beta hydrolase [Acidobacteria bacterium]|nr:alpha/beta hydrolase [Acidobacteriota bacterium]
MPGPPLVLVHGGFSNHITNWEWVLPAFLKHYTVHAIARRGRGATPATEGHSLDDEIQDALAIIDAVGEPVYLLGHSYGAHVALGAAHAAPNRVRKLVLYEAPWPHIHKEAMAGLEALAAAGQWDTFAYTFFATVLHVPEEELQGLRRTADWIAIVNDAPATLHDLRALANYPFHAARYSTLNLPVLLQTGSLSPPNLYVTDELLAVLPQATVGSLEGQAHEGMTTAPQQYADAVIDFLNN